MRRLALVLSVLSPVAAAAQPVLVSPHGAVLRPAAPAQVVGPPSVTEPSVAVVSAATPALSGTYGIGPQALANMAAVVAGIAAGQGFPGGAGTLTWLDAAGAAHVFPTTAEFVAFAAAVQGYVYAEQLAAMGQPATVPAVPLAMP